MMARMNNDRVARPHKMFALKGMPARSVGKHLVIEIMERPTPAPLSTSRRSP
jgi:hypothetical protein